MVSNWKKKKRKTSKFVDAGSYNRNEGEGNWRLEVDRQGDVEKKNKFTLDTERCENIKNLCIYTHTNDFYYYYYYYYYYCYFHAREHT